MADEKKLTDEEITGLFAEMLNRSNKSLFAQGRWMLSESSVMHLYLDKNVAAELVFDERGNLTSITRMD